MASQPTLILETEILTWLHQVKYQINENWIQLSSLFSSFVKNHEKYQNKKMKTSFGRIIHSLSKRKLSNIHIYIKKMLHIRTNYQWVLILLTNDYGIYNPNHAKYKYSTMQLKSTLDYTVIGQQCKVGITPLTERPTNDTSSTSTSTMTNNTTLSTTSHNPKAHHRTSVDDSTIVPQTTYFMPEVCELDSTPNSHTFQTGIQHDQQQSDIQSPPRPHRIIHNHVTPPTCTTYNMSYYSSPSPSFDSPNLNRKMIKNEEVDKMMSGIIE
jgi:hypothetical protein